MLLCTSCTSFIIAFTPPHPHRITRSASSFYDTSFACRICLAVWAELFHNRKLEYKPSLAIYLKLSRPSKHRVRLVVTAESQGVIWVLKGKFYNFPAEDIPTFIKDNGLKETPHMSLADTICQFDFKEESIEVEPEKTPLGLESQPVEFFKRFLPELEQWLNECDNHHLSCREHVTSDALPNRLLYVGEQPGDLRLRLRLREQIPVGSRYLTMSYRWEKNAVRLLENNFCEWLNHIPEDTLPQTLQDGITACRLLKCKYIWIDALCIIQDSHDDWVQESSLMAAIYSGAYLNLAASSFTPVSPDNGLFRRYNELLCDNKPMTIRLHDGTVFKETRLSETEMETEDDWQDRHEVRRMEYDIFRDDFESSHLHTRGWVFQEFYLSCRTLHFLKTTFWWQCKSCVTFGYPKTNQAIRKDKEWFPPKMVFTTARAIGSISDTETKPTKPASGILWKRDFCIVCLFACSFTNLVLRYLWIAAAMWQFWNFAYYDLFKLIYHNPARAAIQDEWVELVNLYVKTSLTNESDRQVAIAGLARSFANRFELCGYPAVYHAGLWSHNLLIELLWTSPFKCNTIEDKSGCPSWSWLYSHGGVTHIKAEAAPLFRHLAQIQKVETVPRDARNPFGPVNFGHIRLLAHSFEAKVGFSEWSHRRESFPRIILEVDVAYNIACPEVSMRVESREGIGARHVWCEDSKEEFTFVILAYGESSLGARYHGLILQRAPSEYPPVSDSAQGEFWVRRGKWEEDTDMGRGNEKHETRKTRKFLKNLMSCKQRKRTFEII